MTEIKKIVSKILLLAASLVALNFIYKETLWQEDINTYSGVEKAIKIAENADILYLGDCSDSYFGTASDHEKGISQFIDSLLPNKIIASVSETGFHAGMFVGVLNSLTKNSKIKTVVVTMNLRSFSSFVLNAYSANSIQQRITMLNESPALFNRF